MTTSTPNDDDILQTLRLDEGYRDRAYQDSLGVWTIGYGTNLQTLRINPETAEEFLFNHYEDTKKACARMLDFYTRLDPVRKGVVTSMAYQLGTAGLMKFSKFLAALRIGDYAKAAEEMLDSKWAKSDSPERAKRHAKRMLTGCW